MKKLVIDCSTVDQSKVITVKEEEILALLAAMSDAEKLTGKEKSRAIKANEKARRNINLELQALYELQENHETRAQVVDMSDEEIAQEEARRTKEKPQESNVPGLEDRLKSLEQEIKNIKGEK